MFKVPGKGFLEVPGTFQAPGHLIPCLRIPFLEKGELNIWELQILGKHGNVFTQELKA